MVCTRSHQAELNIGSIAKSTVICYIHMQQHNRCCQRTNVDLVTNHKQPQDQNKLLVLNQQTCNEFLIEGFLHVLAYMFVYGSTLQQMLASLH